jgi:hypothetical protein
LEKIVNPDWCAMMYRGIIIVSVGLVSGCAGSTARTRGNEYQERGSHSAGRFSARDGDVAAELTVEKLPLSWSRSSKIPISVTLTNRGHSKISVFAASEFPDVIRLIGPNGNAVAMTPFGAEATTLSKPLMVPSVVLDPYTSKVWEFDLSSLFAPTVAGIYRVQVVEYLNFWDRLDKQDAISGGEVEITIEGQKPGRS